MLISEQYRALAGNLVVWALGPGNHPLQIILCSHLPHHLRELSREKWGYSDFTWVVSRGGGKKPGGSLGKTSACVGFPETAADPQLATQH